MELTPIEREHVVSAMAIRMGQLERRKELVSADMKDTCHDLTDCLCLHDTLMSIDFEFALCHRVIEKMKGGN